MLSVCPHVVRILFQKLHRELKRCEPRVASLQAANQVCASQQMDELDNLQTKLDHLRLRLQSLIRLTWLYMLKLGAVLGYDTSEIYSAVDLNLTSSMTSSQEVGRVSITNIRLSHIDNCLVRSLSSHFLPSACLRKFCASLYTRLWTWEQKDVNVM